MENERNLYHDLESILYTREEVAGAVRALGERITADYRGKKPVVHLHSQGGERVLFGPDPPGGPAPGNRIHGRIQLRRQHQIQRRGAAVKDLDRSILGRDVIIVEDIVDSGMTLHFLKKLLITRGAASLRIAALMDKPARRVAPLTVDYSCFQIPDAFVVGYGLDYNERYRNLPDVGVLSPRIYAQEEQ